MNALLAIFHDDGGATMVEYAVMLAFIAAVCLVLVQTLGVETSKEFSNFNAEFAPK